MWSRSLPTLASSLLRPSPASSASLSSGFRHPPTGQSPWILTVPELQPNSLSKDVLTWKNQIPMSVRYNIPTTVQPRIPAYRPPASFRESIMTPIGTAYLPTTQPRTLPEVETINKSIKTSTTVHERTPVTTPRVEPDVSIITPNGNYSITSVPKPNIDKYGSIKDPNVNSVTVKYDMRKSKHHINKGRPLPQVLARIRRKRRRQTLIWEEFKMQRRHAIDKKTANFYIEEKKRIDNSDWWDWYITYDNPPKQF